MASYCYINGKITDSKNAGIAINDIGVLRGYGIFDYLRTYDKKPFLLNEHVERFQNSAKLLKLRIPLSKAEIKKIVDKLLKKNGFKEASFRLVLTGGPIVGNGLEYVESNPTFYIIADKFEELPKSYFEKGVKLITLEHQRIFPEIKSTNYITAVKTQEIRKKEKAFEILYTKNGNVLETTTANFFLVKNNKVITPKKNILMGTTRNFVVKFTKEKFGVEEREVKAKEIDTCDEAFITATNKDVLPVIRIDEKIIGNGKVGKVTKELIKMYNQEVKKNLI